MKQMWVKWLQALKHIQAHQKTIERLKPSLFKEKKHRFPSPKMWHFFDMQMKAYCNFLGTLPEETLLRVSISSFRVSMSGASSMYWAACWTMAFTTCKPSIPILQTNSLDWIMCVDPSITSFCDSLCIEKQWSCSEILMLLFACSYPTYGNRRE